MSKYTGLFEIDERLEREKETKDRLGNRRRATFHSTERYIFDYELDFFRWRQFDTKSDAWYFGIWVNPSQLRTLTYAEGDISFVQCQDAESYDRTIAHLCAAYEPASHLTAIDFEGDAKKPEKMTVTRYYQDRNAFFIDAERGKRFLEEALAEREKSENT